ncbi:septum formation initiator family protein [Streptomyces sp. RKND-216]|uniref:FtsB family cell division protein n=1 Tax=Streptomyces sp. RKND-216 TaxID=2562581 RepID=UPI00109D9D51|nr:septum formation initiator family protein [Streptomyces sp. RKND-216]THA26056.1 septum formation initiator family protein [Streptomyces sp. RKND-216]
MPADRFSTTARLRALGSQAAERVYRAQSRRVRAPRRSRLTGRAALLALVLCSLVVALAYPLRQYIAQQSEIDELRQEAERRQERVEDLRRLKARWQDPAFVEQRARERLHMLRPGETGYLTERGAEDERRPQGDASDRPWYRNLWEGLDAADRGDAADRDDARRGAAGPNEAGSR